MEGKFSVNVSQHGFFERSPPFLLSYFGASLCQSVILAPSKEMMSSHETMENKQHDDTEATTVALRDFIESFQADSTGESCYDECESKRRRKVLLGKIVPELRNITTLSQVMNYWKTNQEKYQGLFDNRAAVLIIIDALLSISSKPLSQDATSEYGLGMLDVKWTFCQCIILATVSGYRYATRCYHEKI